VKSIYLNECEVLPWWAGIAWYRMDRRDALVLPLGLNLIANAAYRLYHALRVSWCGLSWLDEQKRRAYSAGMRDMRARWEAEKDRQNADDMARLARIESLLGMNRQ
jgi:hypothetical protein